MTASLVIATFVASAVGSVHCVAMCGPLVSLHGSSRWLTWTFVHSLGRLATYAIIGAIAGLVGSAIDIAGQVGNVQRAATVVAGLMIVAGGLWTIAVHLGIARRKRRAASPRGSSAFARSLVQIRTKRPALRAWLMGMLTGLIPCGWLWAFAVVAAGTGNALSGVWVMVAFWLGTVPAMVGLLAFAGPVISRLRARLPVATAVTLIAIGLGTLALRWRDSGAAQLQAPHCHHRGQAS